MPYILSTYIFIVENPLFLIPVGILMFLIAGGIYYYIRKKKHERYLAIQRFDEIMKLDWRGFEEFVEDMLQQKGFDTILGRGIKDGGVDVEAKLGDKNFYIQCKKFRVNKVTAPMIQQLNGVVSDTGEFYGKIFATTSGFTADAVSEAKKSGMELWDKDYIINYLKSSNAESSK